MMLKRSAYDKLRTWKASVAAAALVGSKDVNFGAAYENAVAQEILAAGCPLRSYHNNRKGEVDFLVETQDGAVLPVEVKSGKSYKLHTALNNLLGSPEYGIEEAVVLAEANVSTGERAGKRVRYLPLYMAGIVAHDAMADASRQDRRHPLEGSAGYSRCAMYRGSATLSPSVDPCRG